MQEELVKIDLERDLKQITKLVDQYIRHTYIQNIERELEVCKTRSEKEETKEVILLKAVAPFVPQESQKDIYQIIEMMKYETIIKQMLPKLVPPKEKQGKTMRGDVKGEVKKEERVREIIIVLILYQILSKT